MHLVERHYINKQHQFYKEIDQITFKSKNIYNLGLYTIRQEYFKTGQFLNYNKLSQLMKDTDAYKSLPRKVSQQTLMKLDKNWKSYFQANKEFKKNPNKFKAIPKIPQYLHKEEGRFLTTYSTQAINKNTILSGTNIKINTKQIKIKEIRLICKKIGYIIEVVYNKEIKEKLVNKNWISIDLGINNLCSITSNHKNAVLVNGRIVKSINQFYNKKLSTTKSQKKIEFLIKKRYFRLQNYFHHTSKFIIDYCIKNNISKIIVGHNNGWKQDINIGKVNNQKFCFIPFNDLIQKISYKRELAGIEVLVTEESYTSKASYYDLDKLPIYKKEKESPNFSGKRVKRGLYQTKDGFLINADINGSLNISRKVFGDTQEIELVNRSLVARPLRINPLIKIII
jgi:putative transposase